MVVYVNLIYNINLQILQEVGIFLGGRLTDEIESENCLEMM